MKVEIELESLEDLKERIKYLEQRETELQKALSDLDESVLKRNAIRLSHKLFHTYIDTVFKKLGFSSGSFGEPIEFRGDIERELGEKWWVREDRLRVDISVNISNEFKSALLRIGVIPKEEAIEEDDTFKL